MALALPSLDEIHARLLADYRARFPGADASRYSDAWKRLRITAGGLLGVYHALGVARDDALLDTAAGAELDRHGAILGLPRLGGTGASKSDALRVFGTASSTISIGDQLTHSNGLTYELREGGTIPSAGYLDVDVGAVDVGVATRLDAGETLTFISTPSGIQDTAILQIDLDEGGTDAESDGAYRARLLARTGEPAAGGNRSDYRSWALESNPDIATAYVYPNRRGRGSVDIAGLRAGSGSVRALNSTERSDLFDYIDALRPAHIVAFRVLETTTSLVDVEFAFKVTPDSGYGWDWNDTGGALEVLTWTAGTRTLQFTTDRPSDMEIGDKVSIATAAVSGVTGEPITIESFSSTDAVVLAADPVQTPLAGDQVYAGGDLVGDVRDRLLAFLDSLGPVVGNYGVGDWIAEVDPERILAEALRVDGVLQGQTVTPSSTQTLTDTEYPLDTSVPVYVPGQVIVRRLP